MWTCKHCHKQFDFDRHTEKANHARWCASNPKALGYKATNSRRCSTRHNSNYGAYENFQVVCAACTFQFSVTERAGLFPKKRQYFCCRSCANTTGGRAKAAKHHPDEIASYVAVCFRYHERKCCVCGFDKIVQVHHVDHNHQNNDPVNLVPICPNHHQMWHSRFRVEIEDKVLDYINTKWAVGVVADTRALRA